LQSLLGEAHKEIRSISHLSQAPALEKISFTDAVKALCDGFAHRTGLGMSLHVQDDLRIGPSQASTLYRVVQEGLANIHWHSRATQTAVCVYARERMTHVVVADDGIGIKPNARLGVGLAGMRARLAELGGRLTIHPLSPGTAIIASIRHMVAAPAQEESLDSETC
jgi:signal transduction histidine kinase